MKESFLDIHLKGCRVKSNLFRMLTLLLLIFLHDKCICTAEKCQGKRLLMLRGILLLV